MFQFLNLDCICSYHLNLYWLIYFGIRQMFSSYVALRDMWLVCTTCLDVPGSLHVPYNLIQLFPSKVIAEVKSVQSGGHPQLYAFHLLKFI